METSDQQPIIACLGNLIAYNGREPERRKLLKQTRNSRLEARVRFVGVVDDVELVIGEADMTVLASYTEGLPNAVLEAVALGIRVGAADVGRVRGVLESGAGLLVSPHDEVALADTLARTLSDPEIRTRAGRLGALGPSGGSGLRKSAVGRTP